MRSLQRTYLTLLILLIIVTAVKGNVPQVKSTRTDYYARFISFSLLTGNEGIITDIIQDRSGFIWLAGTECLSRFDGNTLTKFVNDWTPHSLPSSKVLCLELDAEDRLWVGTSNGLCLYDHDKGHFKTIFAPGTSEVYSDSNYVQAILADGDSLLWLETLSGHLWKFDLNNFEIIEQYKHPYTNQPYYFYHDIYRDSKGRLWVGGRGIGPFMLDETIGSLRNVDVMRRLRSPVSQRSSDGAYFRMDKSGNLWFGAHDGIHFYDERSSSFELFLPTSSWTMAEAMDGHLWFGTGRGLAKYSPYSGEIIMYEHNEENDQSLSGNYIYKIFEDNYGNVWISTSGGVVVHKPDPAGVRYIYHIPGMEETPASSAITDLMTGDSGRIWIATESKGIDRFDPDGNEITHFNASNTKGLASDRIRCLEKGPEGDIYCGLWAGCGFGKLEPDKRVFSLYTLNELNTHSDWYNDLAFDDAGHLYLGFWGGPGLTCFDPVKRSFGRNLKHKFNNYFESRLITCLHFDSRDQLWMGTTRSGLYRYDPVSDTSEQFNLWQDQEMYTGQREIFDIREDGSRNVWIGTSGLYMHSEETGEISRIAMPEKFSGIEVYCALPYLETDIWLLTNFGLLKYNRLFEKVYDYSSVVSLSFSANLSAAVVMEDGKLMLGSKNGLAIVEPDKLVLSNDFPSVFLSSLHVFDEIRIPDLQSKEKVHLAYDENFFTIHVGSNSWGENSPFRYYYRLDDFSREWTEMKADELVARFTNVPPGDYTFHVKIADRQGNEFEETSTLQLTIVPPVWKTWWFMLLAIIFGSMVLGGVWWNYSRTLRLSVYNLELVQKLLRLQMNPHFIFNSLFAVQRYIYTHQTHLAGKYLSDFAHLIRLILDNSRHEFIAFKNEIECIDLYLKLQKLRFSDQFSYLVTYDEDLMNDHIQIPPMLAQPFLENAIEHGFKNLNRDGHIEVNYKMMKDGILFSVRDNGIGLTASEKLREGSKTEHEPLAISICKKRLEVLNRHRRSKVHFKLEEIINGDGGVEGTLVRFKIPFMITTGNQRSN